MGEPTVGAGGKAAIRASILARRATRSPEERATAAMAITAHLVAANVTHAPTVACYLSMDTEPGTGSLIEFLADRGTEVIVPVTDPAGGLDWARYDADAIFTRTPHGVLEPEGPRLGPDALAKAGLIIVPAVAVDHAGWRLGRGGGYYDRALAHARAPICALVYADELLPVVPHEDHDVPVDLAVSELGIFRVP